MLRYVRKYLVLYYLVSVVPALIYIAYVFFVIGVSGFVSFWTWLAVIGIVVSCSLFSARVMNRAAETEIKKLMRIFYENCDPRLFLEQSKEVFNRIKTPFSEWGSLFVCAYSLACIDVGDRVKAQEIVDTMRISAQAAKKPTETAHICLNMHAPIKILYGPQLALQCLNEAESELMKDVSQSDFQEAKKYIDQERTFDIAEDLQDDPEIIRLYRNIFSNERLFRRMRVIAAYKMAESYHRLGEAEQERSLLQFVVEKGNKLSLVEKAQERLHCLEQVQKPSSEPLSE